MIGLSVYIYDSIAENINGHSYSSRREDGPFYRRAFDEALREWRASEAF